MRKQDIKPGVVYAYQRGRGDYDSPEPIVFLSAPADGKVYSERSHYSEKGPAFTLSPEGTKPDTKRSFSGITTGYPAVLLDGRHPGDPTSLLRVTLADFEAATTAHPGGIKFTVFITLAHITGLYDEMVAEHETRYAARRDVAAREKQEREATRTRAIDVLTALRAHDITPAPIPSYGAVESVSLPLAEAEKLIALLNDREG